MTDLPFKLGDRSIVIIKSLPVLLRKNCIEYMLEDPVLATVTQLSDLGKQRVRSAGGSEARGG